MKDANYLLTIKIKIMANLLNKVNLKFNTPEVMNKSRVILTIGRLKRKIASYEKALGYEDCVFKTFGGVSKHQHHYVFFDGNDDLKKWLDECQYIEHLFEREEVLGDIYIITEEVI